MRRLLRREWILLGFAALAAVQAMVLTWSYGSGPLTDERWFTTGDTLDFLSALNSPAGRTPTGGEAPTILLVFNSECQHCLEVAPLWMDWTRSPPAHGQIVAISREAQEVAEAFATEHAWDAEVWTVDAGELGEPWHTLTSRTPWVFVIDPQGAILAEGHGKDIAEITAFLMAKPGSSP